PACSKPVLTSSSVNGLTIAVINFMSSCLLGERAGGGTHSSEIVCAFRVLGLVQARCLALVVGAQSDGVLDGQRDDRRDDQGVDEDGEGAHGLLDQQVETTTVEQTLDR